MPSTNIASPPQDLVGKSEYRIKNIREKSNSWQFIHFYCYSKKTDIIVSTDKAMEERGKWKNKNF